MSMADATPQLEYLFYNTATGEYIESLPITGVTFSGGPVNQAGSWSGNFDLSDVGLQSKNWGQSTKPNWATLVVDLNGQIVFAGPVTGRKPAFNEQGFTFALDAMEGYSWLSHWVQATDYSSPPYSGITGIAGSGMPIWNKPFLQLGAGATNMGPPYGSQPYIWDPMLMAAQIVADKYSSSSNYGIWGGDMAICCNGIEVWNGSDGGDSGYEYLLQDEMAFNLTGEPTTGLRTPLNSYVSINFPYTSLQILSNILSQYTALGFGVGFDAAVDFAYSAGKYSKINATLNFSYPRRGGVLNYNQAYGPASTLYIDCGKAHDWTFPEDGTAQANVDFETGGNQDIVALENIYTEHGEPYGGYINTEKVTNVANMNSPNPTLLLQRMASSDLNLYSWPPVAPVITVDMFDPECGLGQFIVGQDALVILPSRDQDGNVFDPRFPGGLWNEWRIVSYSATVADAGDCLISFTLDTPPQQGENRQSPTLIV
jgi:hypothetical protein